MSGFWITLLVQAVKAIAGAVVWEEALAAVTDLRAAKMTPAEKREAALNHLRRAFKGVPERLLNLVIEAAVVKAKAS